jgi:hypothetical protein
VTTGTTGAGGWNSGKEVVVEGSGERVTDAGTLQALADAWYAEHGDDWHFAVRGDEFVELSHSGDGIDGAHVYRVPPDKVLVFGGDHGQTRFRC